MAAALLDSACSDSVVPKAGDVAEICYSGRISCHTVPTSDIISKSDLADGIHPGAAGNTRIAKRVLQLMEERKIRR